MSEVLETMAVAADSLATVASAPVLGVADIAEAAEGFVLSADTLGVSLDTLWVLLGAMLVFIMQAGFAMVESGFARTKNTANILMKNLLDFSVSSILFWAIGCGIMIGAKKKGITGTQEVFGVGGFAGDIPNSAFLVCQTWLSATVIGSAHV